MIWVLVAVSLKFSTVGELQYAHVISHYKSKPDCEKMLAYAKAEIHRAHPKATPVLNCVAMKLEANS